VIYIKAGVYNEVVRIPKHKTNLMFLGDGSDKTIISGSMSDSQVGMITWATATVGSCYPIYLSFKLLTEKK
jgi:pectinesterase